MFSLRRYSVRQTESVSSNLYRARREVDGLDVLVGFRPLRFEETSALSRLRHELDILMKIENPHVLRVRDVEDHHWGVAIVLEDPGGSTLDAEAKPLSLDLFWKFSVQLARAVGALHARGLVHGNLKPANLFLSADRGFVRLGGFGVLQPEAESLYSERALRETLPYVSPEQTGRMNRSVDARSDFYALGVVFYELLSGAPPFAATDPLELIHSHIARQPEPLPEFVPPALAAIVRKLLAKTAEARYQSADGLAWDLEQCQRLAVQGLPLSEFTLATRDNPGQLRVPEKLYGRQEESAFLMRTFDRARQGPAQVTLVSGISGQGKSWLVLDLQKPIVRSKGYFAAGKYDIYSQDKPYSAIGQVFTGLINQFLLEDDAHVRRWREAILAAVEKSGQVIIDVIPVLEFLIGKQEPVSALGAEGTEARFNIFFKRFLNALTHPDHPLVLFVDDLQWADLASLRLFEGLLADANLKHLHFIGAYRDNEVTSSHPLRALIKTVRAAGREVEELELKPLSGAVIGEMLQDTLGRSSGELAEALERKTRGNPFFAQQLLKTLHEKGALAYATGVGWTWNLEQIQQTNPTDNVLDLMVARLRDLAPGTREVLSVAACLGNTFALEDVAAVCERSTDIVYSDLAEALEIGLLLRKGALFRFQHDRIQEAGYTLLSPAERQRVHGRAGHRWLAQTADDPAARAEKLFAIVSHLNRAAEPADSAARLELARLNAEAAEKARDCLAYKSGAEFVRVAARLLGERAWDEHYELTYRLQKLLGTCLYLNSEYDAAEQVLDAAYGRCRDIFDRAAVLQEKMRTVLYVNRLEEGLRMGLETLALFGIRLDENPSKLKMLRQLLGQRALVAWKGVGNLPAIPAADDRRTLFLMRTLIDIAPYAFLLGSNVMFSVITEAARLMFAKGNNVYSAFACAGMALGNVAAFGAYGFANRVMRIGLAITDKYPDVDIKSKLLMVHICFIKYWKEPLHDIEESIKASISQTIAAGDKAYGSLTGLYTAPQRILYSPALDVPFDNLGTISDFIITAKVAECPETLLVAQNFIRFLRGEPDAQATLTGRPYGLEDFLASAHRNKQVTIMSLFVAFDAMRGFLKGDYAAAAEALEKRLDWLERSTGLFLHFSNPFFIALGYAESLSGGASARSPFEASRARTVRRMSRRLAKFARSCPENFASPHTLVRAQVARLAGRAARAEELFDTAIAQASRHGWPFFEALANESAGRFYLERGRGTVAAAYLQEACRVYARWGAKAKVDQLRAAHPALLAPAPGPAPQPALQRDGLDLLSVVKASRALSGEIVWSRLLSRLMEIVVENAGAERGVLLRQQDAGDFQLIADARVGKAPDLNAVPLEQSSDLPKTLLQYVARTLKDVVLADATASGDFTRDACFAARPVRSAACVPLLHQGKLTGLLYLENNLGAGIFTEERLETLRLLSSQAAISLENAQLYANLEGRIQERTAELWKKTKDIQVILENIRQGICTFGEDFVIGPEHSAFLRGLLGRDDLAQCRLDRLLLDAAVLDTSRKHEIIEAWRSILGFDAIAFELNSHLLPTELRLQDAQGQAHTWEIDWAPIEDSRGVVRKLMLSIRDVTDLREARRRTEEHERELEMIGQLLRFEPGQFESFAANTRGLLARCRGLLGQAGSHLAPFAREAMLHLHTIKGNARTYGLNGLTQAAHMAEQIYADVQRDPFTPWTREGLEGDLSALEKALADYGALYSDKLRRGGAAPGPASHWRPEVVAFADRLGPDGELSRAFARLFYPTFRQVLRPCLKVFETSVDDLAMTVDGEELRVHPGRVAALEGIFNHLLANSLHHGAMPMQPLRIAVSLAKSPSGAGWVLRYSDGGRGFDLRKLREIGQSKGFIDASSTDEQVVTLIFRSGVSTAARLSETSGRGVGMDAVRQSLFEMGARIRVEFLAPATPEGLRAFEFVIELPESLVVAPDDDDDADRSAA